MSYEEIGLALGIAPGLAYLVGEGRAADRGGAFDAGAQDLANPPVRVHGHDEEVDRWMHERAHQDPGMAAAARARRLGAPARDDMTREAGGREHRSDRSDDGKEHEEDHLEVEGEDVVSLLTHQHNEIRALLTEIQEVPGYRDHGSGEDLSRRVSIADMLVELLSRHEAVEEELFWPAVADAVDNGTNMAALARDQEREGKRVLDELRRSRTDDLHFDELVDQLVELLRTHVAFEESVFVKVLEQIPESSRRSLGIRTVQALRHAPTRPHPHTPSGAGVLHVAGPLAGALDRVRDRRSDRPAAREGRPTNVGDPDRTSTEGPTSE